MKYIERAFPWILLAPVVLPVAVWGGFIYPYLVPKTLLFYAISFIALGMFVLLVTHARAFSWSRLKRWEAWVPGALLVLAYATSAFGVGFYRSFWSLFVRGDGLLMLTCVVASFYMIVLYADRAFFERLLRAVAVVGSAVAVYGIGEWLMGGGRIGSLLGNAAFFAGYLGIAFFATLAAAQSLSKNWRRAAYGGAGLQLVAIVLTATRGTILALVLAGVAYLAFEAFKKMPSPANAFSGALRAARPSPTPKKASAGSGWARALLAILVISGGLFFAFRADLAHVPFAPVARIASIGVNDPDVASRLFIWKNMVTEIGKSPWTGVGAEHIDVLFNRFYDPTQIGEQWFDRSHNAFLDYAAQYGIGGLLLYLALILAFFTTAAREARRDSSRIAGIFSLLAVTYAVQNFFVFDTVSSFWLLLAILAAFLAVSTESSREPVVLRPVTRPASWLFALVLVALAVPAVIRPALAAYDLSQAYLYQLVDPAREVSYLSHGMALGTYGDLEYGYQAYDMYTRDQASSLTGTDRLDVYQATRSILTANFNRYPYDARTAVYLAHMITLAPEGATVDSGLLSSALTRAVTESPKRPQAWFMLVNLSISQANIHPQGSPERAAGYAAARDMLTRYIARVPTLAEPHFVLAQLLYASHDTGGAATEAAKGKAYYTPDLETASRAAVYYETVLDLPDAAFFLNEVVHLDPTNTAAANDLLKIQTYEQTKR